MSHKCYYLKAGVIWIATGFCKSAQCFHFCGKTYPYFDHRYNLTRLNERRVEIPIMMDILKSNSGKNVLEIGNVLSHYNKTLQHQVVDKYEKTTSKRCIQADAETCYFGHKYDLILSVSTFEHIGWDETPRDPEKIKRTILHLRSLLTTDGELIFTAPVGYSPPLNRLIDDGDDLVDRLCLKRINAMNEWEETDWESIRSAKFHTPYPFANGLVVARLKPISAS
ncbi:MAG: hypothetical protein ACOYCD_01085 [Kiritimatiellia bacterium]|jgi:hypothetical protein